MALGCAVQCSAVLCSAVQCCAVMCCAVQCCAVLYCPILSPIPERKAGGLNLSDLTATTAPLVLSEMSWRKDCRHRNANVFRHRVVKSPQVTPHLAPTDADASIEGGWRLSSSECSSEGWEIE